MAYLELTGGLEEEIEEMRLEHLSSPLYLDHGIEFETAFCLTRIGKQPDEYEGPDRYCRKRASKRDEDEYEGHKHVPEAYANSCRVHGGDNAKGGEKAKHHLDKFASLKHGAYAKDKNLIMDFTDDEQDLFDSIMEGWPQIYDWPPKSEDPARYRILRRVAVNEVRAMREEDYLDDAEIVEEEVYGEQGVMGTKDVENPLAREYRLLMAEVTNQMKELGLTPKERQKMDTLESQESKDDAIVGIAEKALDGDGEYDPEAFDE